MNTCYIGIGSNLGDPIAQAKQAIVALKDISDSRLVSVSSLYGSKPMGPSDQPDYVNAVAMLETNLEPLALLDALQHIEQTQGRVRKAERWGPRTLDLDILLINNSTIDIPRLTVPHYGMREREFVLYPLLEIAPQLILPDGTALEQLTKQCPRNGLEIIEQRPA
ncbi:MAG: 2-amino-4-hydroxy-6-hydroxymethyldihydropteridine diphosphokinase [Psychrobium sp.]